MGMYKKPFFMTLFVLISSLCNASRVITEKKTKNQKSTYIVHVDKSKMPASIEHHSIWYESSLKSISDSAEIIYTYDNAIHGFSTRLTANEARLLESQTEILGVLPEKIYKMQTTRTPQFLGIDKITGQFPMSNTDSSDVIIGILDSGIWPESKSFNDSGLGPIPPSWKGECQPGLNFSTGRNFNTSSCNKKLIGARFFKRGIESIMGAIDELNYFYSPRDSEGHGTHTASIAAGSTVEGVSLFGYASGKARGMATRARIATYKVCWGGVCASSDIIAGMDMAISDNVNILSISLGGESQDYFKDDFAIGTFAVMEKGILVSCAAGNSGPSPSSLFNIAPWITTVGAGTLDRQFPAYISLENGHNYTGASLYQGDHLPDKPISIIYAGNASNGEYGKFCMQDTLVPEKVAGKFVLCDSGTNGRSEKGEVVKSAGGLGMVLANTEDYGEELMADPQVLPALSVSEKDGDEIKKYLFFDPNPKATIAFEGTKVGIEPSPLIAAFSARGPNPITPQILKPDLIAPGVNILAAWSRVVSPTELDSDDRRVDFNIVSGTSMSCPHVSGVAALIKSAHPDWSPAMIRSSLMTTAYTTYKDGQTLKDSYNGQPATPLDFGAGHMNPVTALNPGLVYDLTVDDYLGLLCALNYTAKQIQFIAKREFHCDASKQYSVTDFNYPSFVVSFNSNVVKHTRTLTNVGTLGTYKALVTSDDPSVKISVEPEVLSFDVNEKKSYVVTFTTSSYKTQNQYSFGRLQWSNGNNVVGSPIMFTWE